MKIHVEHKNLDEMEVMIYSHASDPELPVVLQNLKSISSTIIGIIDDEKYILKLADIQFFEANNNTVFAHTAKMEYRTKFKLYELEELLNNKTFIRISKWCIANANQIEKVQPSLNTTMVIYFLKSQKQQQLTRSYFKSFKTKILGEK